MLTNVEPLLTLAIVPSKQLKYGLGIAHTLAFIACLMNALPVLVKAVLVVGLMVHYWLLNKRLASECWTIRHTDFLGWQVLVNGQFDCVQILDSTVLTTFAVFLHFRYSTAKKCYIAVFNDALSADDFRQFIVRLKTTRAK